MFLPFFFGVRVLLFKISDFPLFLMTMTYTFHSSVTWKYHFKGKILWVCIVLHYKQGLVKGCFVALETYLRVT